MVTSEEGQAAAKVGWLGGLGPWVGVGVVPRPWPELDWPGIRAGAEHLTGEAVHADWFAELHVRDGVVLGAATPTQERLAFAVGTAVVGLVARGLAWAVVRDLRHWQRHGERRTERIERCAGGIWLARTESAGVESDLEGMMQQRLTADLQPLEAVLRAASVSPTAWLNHARGEPSAAASDRWSRFIAARPALSGRLVQESLVGIGALGSPSPGSTAR